ncbi:hypothetical protein E5C33_09430 [Stenotrophomonas maltophilia]|uniref:hypothetical protein n=1 Tax=Stenotrophomonas maltophilia TaxID=40324 RepID=UPI0010760A69|nr:hypothetical protein [Stenotrophomonas maltophilia]TFZ45685.1 hypothetical protein E5C33_09430 [Stenotrophomonas maltophilia]
MQREQAESAYAAAGLTPEQARAVATAQRAGFNPAQASGYSGDMQLQDIRDRALNATDWNDRNALLAVLEGKPVQLAGISGQNLINNRYVEGGGGISTTDQGRASIAAYAARARASDASAASSYATADSTRQRLAIAQQQFGLQRDGQWNPGGSPAGGATGTAGQKMSSDELKQVFAGKALADDAYDFAAAYLGKTPEQVRLMTPEQIRTEVAKGGRLTAGPLVGRLPGANILANSDLDAYTSSAAGRQARINNPSGPVTDADFKAAERSVFSSTKPASVNADLIFRALQRGAASASGGALAPAPSAEPRQRARNPQTGQVLVLINGQWVPE